MTLVAEEIFELSKRAELRTRVEILSLIVAKEVATEPISDLSGGIDEHNSRFALAVEAQSPSKELVTKGSKGVATNLRDVLTMPEPLSGDETLQSRAARLAVSLTDEQILGAIRENWTFASGFDLNGHLHVP